MAYTPTIWSENDIITAEKLNNIENGIGNLRDFYDIGELTVIDFPSYTSKVMIEKELTEEQFLEIKEKEAIKGFIKVNNTPFPDSNTIDIPFESSTFITGTRADGEFINFSFYIKHSVLFGEISISLMIVSDPPKPSYGLIGICLLDYNSIIQLQGSGSSSDLDPFVKGYPIAIESETYFKDDIFTTSTPSFIVDTISFDELKNSSLGITLVVNVPNGKKEYFYLEKTASFFEYPSSEDDSGVLFYGCCSPRYQMYGIFNAIAILCEVRKDTKGILVQFTCKNLITLETSDPDECLNLDYNDLMSRIRALEEAVGITEATNSIT